MTFFIGSFEWEVVLVDGYVYVNNSPKMGGSCMEKQEVYVSRMARPAMRKCILWHELAHVVKDTCDIYERDDMSIEAACNISGLLPVFIGELALCKLGYFVTAEKETEMIQFMPDGSITSVS